MRALGVAPLLDHAAGRLSLEAAAAIAKADTRKYAKRQRTWFKRNMISWNVIELKEMERLIDKALSFIDC
jgi:tRNA dimethylallyltransferase